LRERQHVGALSGRKAAAVAAEENLDGLPALLQRDRMALAHVPGIVVLGHRLLVAAGQGDGESAERDEAQRGTGVAPDDHPIEKGHRSSPLSRG
jgi:hypothetical protein